MGQVTGEVQTGLGPVKGLQRGRHQAFLGLPFARPPVGPLRFAAPQPPEPWTETRNCTAFAPSCPQPLDHAVPGFAASGERDEDCLYLDVYTPGADGQRRPVMVWVHGGGLTHGSGSEPLYDGGPLVERGDVVVVSIHYRLGPLGFLYLGAHGGDAWGADANVGLLDQVAALRWVRDHVAAFGGDPDDVTVFGESAGALSIGALLAMPSARGLFRRAIAQSGTANRLGNVDTAAKATSHLLKQLGLSEADAQRLRELPAQALVDAHVESGARLGAIWGPDNLPQRPLQYVRDGGARDVQLLIGTNRDESKLFVPRDRPPLDDAALARRVAALLPARARARVDEVIGIYRNSRSALGLPHDNLDLLDAIGGDASFRTSARKLAAAQVVHQPGTFLYLFTWPSPARRGALGSCHALEIPFVFGATDQPMQRRFAGAGPEATALSHAMMDAWIAFARSGDPSHAGIGTWPPYDPATERTMVFDATSAAVDGPLAEEARIWDELLAR